MIVLDARGFSDGDRPATGYDLDTVADEVHAFIGAAELGRPGGFDVVTHDLGGWKCLNAFTPAECPNYFAANRYDAY